ncbi:hypothetical protein Ari01nite_15830 [Paractinoplanes rishiriensis]|uniref:histidine kinase n=1 Tax=Paractinoplanes rishiriensis TaxID=1050105 RepID=A0A919MSV6_9ACTN|nr:hypothetical protein Ari01nite_15830 [Actinoplanes rishiriensis]
MPGLLAAAQFAAWPGLPLLRGEPPATLPAIAVSVTVLLTAAALGWRRRRPVAVTVVVAAGIALGTWAAPAEQQFFVPGDALLPFSLASFVAMFGVAARCGRRTTAYTLLGLVALQAALTAADTGVTSDFPLEVLTGLILYGGVAAWGRLRGRWIRDRAAAARRLAEARRSEAEAATAERHRLARELHDVTAHHLTSIVVNASAAEMVGDQRPELRPQAVDFARRTGRDTLAALHRLVEILPFDEPRAEAAPGLASLAEDFRGLGQPIGIQLPSSDPPPALAAAAYGIAREALTNTLRYAPGGPVTLLLRYAGEQAELVIDDAGPRDGTAPATGLGGGRGVTGMRERAAALGGTLTAGPRDDGAGWRVRAVLPLTAGDTPAGRFTLSPLVLDLGVLLLVLLLPLAGLAVAVEDGDVEPAAATLILLAQIAHGVPLMWRRTRPWTVLAAVIATAWLGPLLVAADVTPPDGSWLFLFSATAEFVAVAAVASRGARPPLAWLGALAAAGSSGLAVGTLLALEPPTPTEEGPIFRIAAMVLVAMVVAVLLAVPMTASVLIGAAARRRRDRRRDREEGGVHAALANAAFHAGIERARVAAGLRDAVLRHAADVPAAAERADLPGVVTAARQALSAMRALLDGLAAPPVAPPADPPNQRGTGDGGAGR